MKRKEAFTGNRKKTKDRNRERRFKGLAIDRSEYQQEIETQIDRLSDEFQKKKQKKKQKRKKKRGSSEEIHEVERDGGQNSCGLGEMAPVGGYPIPQVVGNDGKEKTNDAKEDEKKKISRS